MVLSVSVVNGGPVGTLGGDPVGVFDGAVVGVLVNPIDVVVGWTTSGCSGETRDRGPCLPTLVFGERNELDPCWLRCLDPLFTIVVRWHFFVAC